MQWMNAYNPERLRVELADVRRQIDEVRAVAAGQRAYRGPVPDLSRLLRQERDLQQRIGLCTFEVAA